MGTFTLTNKAKADLKSIAVYTQRKWGNQQRRHYIQQFDDAFHMLAESPAVGNKCDFISPGYRRFPNVSHIVFYRQVGETEIEIVRVLHKRMDVRHKLEGA